MMGYDKDICEDMPNEFAPPVNTLVAVFSFGVAVYEMATGRPPGVLHEQLAMQEHIKSSCVEGSPLRVWSAYGAQSSDLAY